MLADIYERQGEKKKAVEWYKKCIPFSPAPEFTKDLQKRIDELSK
jgi:hypothetical protein